MLAHKNVLIKGKPNLKKVYPFALTIFFVILIALPLYWILRGDSSPEESVVEARTLVALQPATNPNLQRALNLIKERRFREGAEILINIYINSTFVQKFERVTTDQFPFRMSIIKFSKALDRAIIKLTYAFNDDPVIPADMTSDIYYDSENDQLLFSPTLFNETTKELINDRIKNYEDLIQAHLEQNFYLFYHQTLHNSEYHPMARYFAEADNGQSIEYFEKHLPEGLQLQKFNLTGMDDHLKYYYRTDHHWTVFAILRAYEEIYSMLSQDFTEISPMLTYDEIVKFPKIDFLGLMARRTFYPIDGDDFAVEVIDFPSHDMVAGGQEVESTRPAYFAGDYSTIPYTNHFNEFYGNVADLIEYTFDNNSNRNLLIIGSSFRVALDPLLASHYQITYCIDLRYYTSFSLSEFLREHDVDDILVVGDNEVALDDIDYWKIKP